MNKTLPAPPKYRIGAAPAPLPDGLVETLVQCETTMLGHILYWGAMETGLRPNAGLAPRIAGRALTVQCPGPCSTILHHAIGLAEAGDILVIDRLGDTRHACLGDGVAEAARRAGIIAAIIDGPCTDTVELAEMGFPVWCRGTSPVTTRLLDLGGRAQVTVSCGGVPVAPGDAVLADADGIYALAPDEALATAAIALERGQIVAARRAARTGDVPPLGRITGATAMVEAGLEK